MDYVVLADEISTDPLIRGYAAMSDAEVATDMNTVYRTRDKDIMQATEVYNAIDEAEFIALTDPQKEEVWNIVHMGEVNPFGLEATRFITIFGGGSTTISTLQGLRVEDIPRGVELGLGTIRSGHVQKARAL